MENILGVCAQYIDSDELKAGFEVYPFIVISVRLQLINNS